MDITTAPPAFLIECIPPAASINPDGPLITLTYAQSLDAKIAGKNGEQIKLSGPESMLMTHWMRVMHDGIMIGVQTAINDDPRLNVRLLPASEHSKTPRPLVLDPSLRLPPTARLLTTLKDASTPNAKAPWVLCQRISSAKDEAGMRERRQVLEAGGARVIEVNMVEGRLDWNDLPTILPDLGLRSVMIEGGSRVIQDLLLVTKKGGETTRPLVDLVIVTVAPMYIPDGLGVNSNVDVSERVVPDFKYRRTEVLGKDAIMVLTP